MPTKLSFRIYKVSKNLTFTYSFSRTTEGDFPGGPVASTPHSQCRGPGSVPDRGTEPTYCNKGWTSCVLKTRHSQTNIKKKEKNHWRMHSNKMRGKPRKKSYRSGDWKANTRLKGRESSGDLEDRSWHLVKPKMTIRPNWKKEDPKLVC